MNRAGGRTRTPRGISSRRERTERSAAGSSIQTQAQKMIAREQRKARAEFLRQAFLRTLRARHLPEPTPEHRFDEERRWRFDFAWPEHSFAIEQDGLGGRHQFTAGFLGDLEKLNTAALLGWTVLRFSTREMSDGTAAEWARAYFEKRRRHPYSCHNLGLGGR